LLLLPAVIIDAAHFGLRRYDQGDELRRSRPARIDTPSTRPRMLGTETQGLGAEGGLMPSTSDPPYPSAPDRRPVVDRLPVQLIRDGAPSAGQPTQRSAGGEDDLPTGPAGLGDSVGLSAASPSGNACSTSTRKLAVEIYPARVRERAQSETVRASSRRARLTVPTTSQTSVVMTPETIPARRFPRAVHDAKKIRP